MGTRLWWWTAKRPYPLLEWNVLSPVHEFFATHTHVKSRFRITRPDSNPRADPHIHTCMLLSSAIVLWVSLKMCALLLLPVNLNHPSVFLESRKCSEYTAEENLSFLSVEKDERNVRRTIHSMVGR